MANALWITCGLRAECCAEQDGSLPVDEADTPSEAVYAYLLPVSPDLCPAESLWVLLDSCLKWLPCVAGHHLLHLLRHLRVPASMQASTISAAASTASLKQSKQIEGIKNA